jgi:Flp pilus assembly protein TadG
MRNLRSRLCRRPASRAVGCARLHPDRGAVGVLVAVLIGGGVLFGMGALVVDVGQVFQNRAELQNGADAAALAVARSCALGACDPSLATRYASANASALTGGKAAVDLVCGSGPLGGCPAATGALTDCPPPPAGNYVDVHTSTLTAGGSSLLPPAFARTLLGNSGYPGTTVRACAQAAWGAPAASYGLAVTISACTWDQATALGTSFASPPPYPPDALPAASADQALKLHTTASATGCPTEPAGADAPGNFGWTVDSTGSCQVYVSGSSYTGSTGTSASQACQQAISAAQASRSLVFLPVYVSVSGSGSNVSYTLKGFAAFVITGYHLPGLDASDWLNPANNCHGSDFCINGYFTQGLIPTTGTLGGTNLGATVVELTG